jgi:hypothetical protein
VPREALCEHFKPTYRWNSCQQQRLWRYIARLAAGHHRSTILGTRREPSEIGGVSTMRKAKATKESPNIFSEVPCLLFSNYLISHQVI